MSRLPVRFALFGAATPHMTHNLAGRCGPTAPAGRPARTIRLGTSGKGKPIHVLKIRRLNADTYAAMATRAAVAFAQLVVEMTPRTRTA